MGLSQIYKGQDIYFLEIGEIWKCGELQNESLADLKKMIDREIKKSFTEFRAIYVGYNGNIAEFVRVTSMTADKSDAWTVSEKDGDRAKHSTSNLIRYSDDLKDIIDRIEVLNIVIDDSKKERDQLLKGLPRLNAEFGRKNDL